MAHGQGFEYVGIRCRLKTASELWMRKLLLLPLLAAVMAVSACNTVAGIGKDMEAAGAAVKSTADDARH